MRNCNFYLPDSTDEEARLLGTVALEDPEALPAGPEPMTSEGSIDGAPSYPDASHRELVRALLGTEARPSQRHCDHLTFDSGIELGWASRTAPGGASNEAIWAIAHETLAELIVERARDAELLAGRAHVAQLLEPGVESDPSTQVTSGLEVAAPGTRRRDQERKRRSAVSAIAKTSAGEVRGAVEGDLVVFRGIPFAPPPVGERRWLPPEPPDRWTGVRDAVAFSPVCPQELSELIPPIMKIDARQDEDCLYLNLWTPRLDDRRRPVMVWIHGGGFYMGAASQALYDGQHLARRGDTVIVTVNYRMGPLGFVHLREVSGGAIPASGNEGLLDQIAALEWVRDNIETFGGDPENVTIFGESAGGMSVSTLLAMPRARGLFHKAIPQSGPGHYFYSAAQSTALLARPMLEALDVSGDDVAALRAATSGALLEAFPSFIRNVMSGDPRRAAIWARPVLDSETLPRPPEDALAAGVAAGVPVLAGTTRDEMAALDEMAAREPVDLSEEGLVKRVREECPGVDAAALIKTYREARRSRMARTDPLALLAAIMTHQRMWIGTTRLLDAQRPHAPVYHYIFTWMTPAGDGGVGAQHGIDIGFTFGTHAVNADLAAFYGRGPAADALAHAVMDAWLAFARHGDPSSAGVGTWPPYEERDRATMMIGESTQPQKAPFEAERRAWDGVPSDRLLNILS